MVPRGGSGARLRPPGKRGGWLRLTPQDKVIVHGVQKVFFPGMPVAPKQIAMGAPAPSPQVAMK